jgi:hypothetical protein
MSLAVALQACDGKARSGPSETGLDIEVGLMPRITPASTGSSPAGQVPWDPSRAQMRR